MKVYVLMLNGQVLSVSRDVNKIEELKKVVDKVYEILVNAGSNIIAWSTEIKSFDEFLGGRNSE